MRGALQQRRRAAQRGGGRRGAGCAVELLGAVWILMG